MKKENKDKDGTKRDREMTALRKRLLELEASEDEHARVEEQVLLRSRELKALFEVAGILVQPGSFETKASRVASAWRPSTSGALSVRGSVTCATIEHRE